MSAEWFCQIAGTELGPLSSQQVKAMVAKGRLLPDDVIRRGTEGPWIPASRVKGLFPQQQGQSAPGTVVEKPSQTKKVAKQLPVARQATAGAKPGADTPRPTRAAGQPAGKAAPAGKPAPKTDSKAPAPPPGEFPDELAGGIPAPERGLNFDRLAIDTSTPLKIASRKSSRTAGMKKEEHKKFMLYMGGGIGIALLLTGILVTAFLLSRGGSSTKPAEATADKDNKPAEGEPGKATKTDTKGDDSDAEETHPKKPDKSTKPDKTHKGDKSAKGDKKPKHVKSNKDDDQESTEDSPKKSSKHSAKTKPEEKFGDLDINKPAGGDKESSDPKPKKPARDFSEAPAARFGQANAAVNALVTGAGGFLGLYIVEQLAARGDHVRALCRRRCASLDALGIETVVADIRDRQATLNACRGVDVVFHAAGLTGIAGPWRHYYEVNTLGTQHVVEGCRRMASAGWFTPALPASLSMAAISAAWTSRPPTPRIGSHTIRTARPWPSSKCWRPAAATGCLRVHCGHT